MEYVYKYENDVGKVLYVGITNNMQRRVSQHKNDKLEIIENPIIYYFPVSTRADAEMLETYLINHYKTGQYYNVSKTKKGIFTFLDVCELLPWVKWNGECNAKEKPFVFSSLIGKENIKEVTVVKKVYVDSSKSISKKIDKQHNDRIQLRDAIKERTKYEEDVIEYLQKEIKAHPGNEIARQGLALHLQVRKAIRLWDILDEKDPISYVTFREKEKMLLDIWTSQENKLRRFENKLARTFGNTDAVMPIL